MNNLKILKSLIREFYPYAKNRLGFNKKANIKFVNDLQNASDPLGKTAYYDPEQYTITVYITGRHPKDLLRSISHELVHHSQNCKGLFKNNLPTEENYIQSSPQLRKLEKEAYEKGNLLLRDFEERKKAYKKELQEMSIKELFNKRDSLLNESLMKKFNIKERAILVPDEPYQEDEKEKELKETKYFVKKGDQYYTGKGLSPWSTTVNETLSYKTLEEAKENANKLNGKVYKKRFMKEDRDEEMNKGAKVEAEHEDTIRKIKNDSDMSVKDAEKEIASDHVDNEDKKYYTKLTSKKCDL